MLIIILWGQYTMYTILLLTLYYGVLMIVYKQELLHMIQTISNSHKKLRRESNPIAEGIVIENYLDTRMGKEASNANLLVHDLVDEIQAYTSAVGEDEEKEIILSGISLILKKYPTLENTHLQESIEELISVSCENNCSVFLSESEIRGLWQKAG